MASATVVARLSVTVEAPEGNAAFSPPPSMSNTIGSSGVAFGRERPKTHLVPIIMPDASAYDARIWRPVWATTGSRSTRPRAMAPLLETMKTVGSWNRTATSATSSSEAERWSCT